MTPKVSFFLGASVVGSNWRCFPGSHKHEVYFLLRLMPDVWFTGKYPGFRIQTAGL